jgi:hypothetical protein
MAIDPDWLHNFSMVTFTRVVDDWLAPALGLPSPLASAIGVEVQFVSPVGVEQCSVAVTESGSFVYFPTSVGLKNIAAKSVEKLIRSGVLRVSIRLTSANDSTWGSKLRAALQDNVQWGEARMQRTADHVCSTSLPAWIAKHRKTGDSNELAMGVAILENACQFLKCGTHVSDRKAFEPWKVFVAQASGGCPTMLISFCPRRVLLDGHLIVSSALDFLAPRPVHHVNRMLAAMQKAILALRKPCFSPMMLFSHIGDSCVTCAAESVLEVHAGQAEAPTDFYINKAKRDDVSSFIENHGYTVDKDAARRFSVMGIATTVERWKVDHRVVLQFVETAVLDKFNHTLEVTGCSYRCQQLGMVATHAIARLMKLVQEGRADEAAILKHTISRFHENTHLGFPIIGGKTRKKRMLYFSDYNCTFHYKSDKSVTVPDQIFPLSYTKHMHEKAPLHIWTAVNA